MILYDQARATCEEHRFIIGTQIRKGWRITGVVSTLIVAPFDGINQYRFLKTYKQTQDQAEAIRFYKGELYTVLVVVKPVINPNDIFTIELEKYLAEQTIHAGSLA